GVNKFQDRNDVEPKINTIDAEIERRQVSRLKEFRNSRDKTKVDQALSALQDAAEKPNENLMPHIIYAVKSNVTLGEISNTFVQVFGRYEPKISF
ncbi:MAG TPA: methylmalonyl-CoA mutase family protein, partial [Nitrososphaeraceae archaeon]|nr:methylmalonyl-CoA mutase family protein [Nitrososphaeraceae archaeon]